MSNVSVTAIPEATIHAYLATDYKVAAAQPFILKIGIASPELMRLNRTDSAMLITAWNPLSEPTPTPENLAAQQKLLAEIDSRGLRHLDAEGCDPSGRWPCEPSLLVFGISLEAAKKLAAQFRQNGFVYAGGDAIPRLILLR